MWYMQIKKGSNHGNSYTCNASVCTRTTGVTSVIYCVNKTASKSKKGFAYCNCFFWEKKYLDIAALLKKYAICGSWESWMGSRAYKLFMKPIQWFEQILTWPWWIRPIDRSLWSHDMLQSVEKSSGCTITKISRWQEFIWPLFCW